MLIMGGHHEQSSWMVIMDNHHGRSSWTIIMGGPTAH